MSASVEMWNFLLYCVQQLGMLLGVGAEIILLVAYVFSVRDDSINAHEEHFALSLRRVVDIGLFFIVTSGAAITYLHITLGQGAIVLEPAFLFKWLLIWMAFALAVLHRKITVKSGLVEGLSGGVWLALLVVHITAPVSTWNFLLILFAVWMIAFMTVWSLSIYFVGGKHIFFNLDKIATFTQKKAAPKVAAPPPAALPVAPPLPPVVKPAPILPPPPPPKPKPIPPPTIPAPPPPIQKPPAPPVVQPPPRPVPVPTPKLQPAPSNEVFPYKNTVVDPMNILHPHLTGENDQGIVGRIPNGTPRVNPMSMNTAEVTEHLPAVRVMPRSQEDLDTQHRGPIVKFG